MTNDVFFCMPLRTSVVPSFSSSCRCNHTVHFLRVAPDDTLINTRRTLALSRSYATSGPGDLAPGLRRDHEWPWLAEGKRPPARIRRSCGQSWAPCLARLRLGVYGIWRWHPADRRFVHAVRCLCCPRGHDRGYRQGPLEARFYGQWRLRISPGALGNWIRSDLLRSGSDLD